MHETTAIQTGEAINDFLMISNENNFFFYSKTCVFYHQKCLAINKNGKKLSKKINKNKKKIIPVMENLKIMQLQGKTIIIP